MPPHEVLERLSLEYVAQVLRVDVADDERRLHVAAAAGVDPPVGEYRGSGEEPPAGAGVDRRRLGDEAGALQRLVADGPAPVVEVVDGFDRDHAQVPHSTKKVPEFSRGVAAGNPQAHLDADRGARLLL